MKNLSIVFVLFLVVFGVFVIAQAFSGNGLLTWIKLPKLGAGSTLGSYIEMPRNGDRVLYPKESGPVSSGAATAVPQEVTASNNSLYYKKVYFGSVQRPYSTNDTHASFSLYADSSLSAPVDITGWKVKGNGAYGFVLPTAVASFERTMIMFSSAFRGTDDIVLRAGDYATFYSATSPMNGVNLRLNKCTGYLNENYSFSPSLPYECPRIESPRTVYFTGKCQEYLRTINSCHTPTQDSINTALDTNDVECRAFVSRLTYDGCFADHRTDTDFYSREWRVWLNQFLPFDLLHDRIVLYDRQGLEVNEYTY